MTRQLSAAAVIVAVVVTAQAQPATGPTGYWEGVIKDPGKELKIGVALAKSADGWKGNIAVPTQNVKAMPLTITVEGDAVSFGMPAFPGTPTFKGKVSQDGKSLTGDFTQGTRVVPFALTRTESTPITRDFEGAWEAEVNDPGERLRFTLTLSNAAGGSATGKFISVDQGNEETPIVAIVQTGSHLLVRAAHGTYQGDFKDGQIVGTWTQGPTPAPLVFRRPKPAR